VRKSFEDLSDGQRSDRVVNPEPDFLQLRAFLFQAADEAVRLARGSKLRQVENSESWHRHGLQLSNQLDWRQPPRMVQLK